MSDANKPYSSEFVWVLGWDKPDHEAWLKLRAEGMGGSDAARLTEGYGSEVWASKVMDQPDSEPTVAMRLGLYDEAFIADLYAERTGCEVVEVPMMRSTTHGWMLANVDRLVVGDGPIVVRDGGAEHVFAGGVEVKRPTARNWRQWREQTPPLYPIVQATHYIAVTGATWWDVVALVDDDIEVFRLHRDEEAIEQLVAFEREFWTRYVVPREPPPDVTPGVRDQWTRWQHPNPEGVDEPTDEDLAWARRRAELSAQKKAAEGAIREGDALMRARHANAEAVKGSGLSASWKERAGRVDYKRLLGSLRVDPNTIEKFRGKPSRGFYFRFKEDA